MTIAIRRPASSASESGTVTSGCACMGRSTVPELPVQRCTVLTRAGAYLTDGLTVLIDRAPQIEARVTELTEPGALLNAYLGKGVRSFLLTLEDGRTLHADLTSTSWQSSGRRLCRFLLTPSEIRA
jgi:hypothetical protein